MPIGGLLFMLVILITVAVAMYRIKNDNDFRH